MEKLFNLKNYNFKIIFDEVFTGFYKSEKMFCFQTFDEKIPDVLCLSETLGGGKSSISSLIIDDDTYKSAYSKINETFYAQPHIMASGKKVSCISSARHYF